MIAWRRSRGGGEGGGMGVGVGEVGAEAVVEGKRSIEMEGKKKNRKRKEGKVWRRMGKIE